MSTLRRLLLAASGAGSFLVLPTTDDLRIVYNGTIDGGVTYAIGAATRTAGVYAKGPSNPILQKLGSGWERDGVKDPWLVYDGTQFVLYYAGYKTTGGDAQFKIGRATAPTWAALVAGTLTREATNPVLNVGGAGAFDETDVQNPQVYFSAAPVNGHSWWLFYTASAVGGGVSPGLAHSDDGITWTKDGAVTAAGALQKIAGVYEMLYTSGGVRHATLSVPGGSYTLDSGNPLLRHRGISGFVSVNPTADAAAGASVFTIPSGSGADLEPGEPLFIVDSVHGPEIGELASSTATTLTLVSPLSNSYHVAHGLTVRSLAYTIIDVRAFRQMMDGSFEAFGVAFQPGTGLSFSGNALWEGSLRYTAPALGGPWEYDWTTGLIFPLTTLGAAWDSVSAENMSVISVP